MSSTTSSSNSSQLKSPNNEDPYRGSFQSPLPTHHHLHHHHNRLDLTRLPPSIPYPTLETASIHQTTTTAYQSSKIHLLNHLLAERTKSLTHATHSLSAYDQLTSSLLDNIKDLGLKLGAKEEEIARLQAQLVVKEESHAEEESDNNLDPEMPLSPLQLPSPALSYSSNVDDALPLLATTTTNPSPVKPPGIAKRSGWSAHHTNWARDHRHKDGYWGLGSHSSTEIESEGWEEEEEEDEERGLLTGMERCSL